MIKVYKSEQVPASLVKTSAYDGEDVKRQLLTDQHGKCYICERCRDTDFEIEHHKSLNNRPDLFQDWNNLFMGCAYCNRKKSDSFDNTLSPKDNSIEDEIEQRIDFVNKKALFFPRIKSSQHIGTAELLNRVYNGSRTIRTIKEERFFEQALSIVSRFLYLIGIYQNSLTPENKQAVRDEIAINKEMLGFKYWIIRSNPSLYAVFAQDMAWNK